MAQMITQTNVFPSSFSFFLTGKGGVGAGTGSRWGLLGNAAVSLAARQSCRRPSYLFITGIINVYTRLLIALFTNDLWDL